MPPSERIAEIRIHADLIRRAPGVPSTSQKVLLVLLEEYDALAARQVEEAEALGLDDTETQGAESGSYPVDEGPARSDREVMLEALRAIDYADSGKSCSRDGCNHRATYQDSGSVDWCACHYWDEDHPFYSECDGQPGPSAPKIERQVAALLAVGFHL